jgi:hypothetical protein
VMNVLPIFLLDFETSRFAALEVAKHGSHRRGADIDCRYVLPCRGRPRHPLIEPAANPVTM